VRRQKCLPPIHLLGSSGYSAELAAAAAAIGAGFAFAHHFATNDAVDAMTSYRTRFRPSAALAHPHCPWTTPAA
jgi:alkanesulfonate monooxygenase SsuD/methylene tetrahydromethanopterin reductase-like flavin-dependent oxidoreductase (luciferase family)